MFRFLKGLLVLGLLVGAAAVSSGRLNEVLPLDLPSPVLVEAADNQDVRAVIQQLIQRSNEEQVQAIAARDPTLMGDTVTDEHYQELVRVNQDLLDNGVISIGLVSLDWGAVAVDGATATATTYETWTTTFADGTTGRSRDRNDYVLVLDNGTWKIKSDAHPGQAPSGSTPPQVAPAPRGNQNSSHNWSGYATSSGGGGYSAVSATWSVPQFNSEDSSFGVDAAWVGIGGVRSRDLIQAGTQQTVSGNGRTQYEAWVEMLPRSSRPVPLRVHPGDSISVAISEQDADQWLIDFTNNTTGQTYQETQTYHSSHSSAEWIEEAPSGGRGGVLPLSNFGSIDFSAGSTVKDGQSLTIGAAGARPITMVGNDDQALAVPSALGSDGASFSVARTDAPATAGPRSRGFFQPAPIDDASGN